MILIINSRTRNVKIHPHLFFTVIWAQVLHNLQQSCFTAKYKKKQFSNYMEQISTNITYIFYLTLPGTKNVQQQFISECKKCKHY